MFSLRTYSITILFPFVTLLVGACSHGIDLSKYPKEGQFPDPISTVVQNPKLPELSAGFINTGYNIGPQAFSYDGGSWFISQKSVFTAILIVHPKATFLFDTGLGKNIEEQFAVNSFLDKMLISYEKLDSAAVQLQKHGTPPENIQIIIPSHLHWDHASGIEDFPKAEVWVQKKELEWAKTVPAPNVLQKQIDGKSIKWKFFSFTNQPYENFPQSLDWFGDGSIVLVPLEGHSSGMVGMFVNFRSGKRLFFPGDTTWTLEGIEIPAEKSSLVIQLLEPDRDRIQTQKDIVKLHRLSIKYPELHLIPAHDDRVYQQLGYFPHLITK